MHKLYATDKALNKGGEANAKNENMTCSLIAENILLFFISVNFFFIT